MADPTSCYPWWHFAFAPALPTLSQAVIASGCTLNAAGNIGCAPEAMRKDAEKQLRARGLDWPLTIDAYSLARNIQTEVGARSLEAQVALAETTVNQAKRRRTTVHNLIVNPQPYGHPNRGYYGNINKTVEGKVVAAGTGRFTSTSSDPTLLAITIANLALSGLSGNYARGADDQDGPDAWANQGQAYLNQFVRNRAANHQYWVGPIPGIDHWLTFLQITVPGIAPDSAMGQQLIQRGINALQLPVVRPTWSAALPVCSPPKANEPPPARKMLAAAMLVGGAVAIGGGIWWLTRHLTPALTGITRRQRRLGARTPEAGSRGDVSDDEWEVAEDALLEVEGKTGRARDKQLHEVAKILVEIRRGHGHVTPTKPYERAFHQLPMDDQFKIHEWSSEDA